MRESSPKSALYCAEPDCRESAFLVIRLNQAEFSPGCGPAVRFQDMPGSRLKYVFSGGPTDAMWWALSRSGTERVNAHPTHICVLFLMA